MENVKENVESTNVAPERIEIPTALMGQLGFALQRHQGGLDAVNRAQVEIENVRLQTLLAARVDRPELYQVDLSQQVPTLRRMGVAPGAAVPVAPPPVPPVDAIPPLSAAAEGGA